ncbi:MAG: inositol monophosphatase [Magnetococcales bacterium]|nr:inositol monophosphatase [Magnetococcales bacterium]
MNYSPHTNVAIRAARQAGNRAAELFSRRHELEVRNKDHGEWVSNADTAVEREILYHLKKGYPQYGIVAEESGRQGEGSERYWIVDPIDGTDNFIHGIPHFALSIALAEANVLLTGVVFNPISNEMFVAERGRGAYLNDRRIRTGQNRLLSKALLATGFPAKHKEHLPAYLDSFRILCAASHGIRRQGSAALDLCFVADDRYDGFWEQGLSAWDVAAGALVLQEAGGFITDFAGEDGYLRSGNLVAANAAIHSRLLEKIQSSALYRPAKESALVREPPPAAG